MPLPDYHKEVDDIFDATIRVHQESKHQLSDIIVRISSSIIESLNNGNKVLIMGNGGSAADASHMAAELVGRFQRQRRPLPAIALTTDTSLMTAVANDFGYAHVFARQCLALVKPGDVVIAISTSGKSQNIIEAIRSCNNVDAVITIGLTGQSGGELSKITKLNVNVPSESTSIIQEIHRTVIHAICKIIDEYYAEKK